MKKLLFLFTTLLLISCSVDDDSSNNKKYFFEIEFAGETHKVEYSNHEIGNGLSANGLYAMQSQGIMMINFVLNDITSSNYVSGSYIQLSLAIYSPEVGINEGKITFGSTPYMYDYFNSLNIQTTTSYVENTPMLLVDAYKSDLDNKVTLNVTDLGKSPTSYMLIDTGEPVKGSYEGVLYYPDITDTNNSTMLDVPVPIKISFSAPRTN